MLTGSEIAAFVAEQRELCTNATPGPWHEGVNGNPRVYGPDDSLGSGLIAAFTRWQDRPFIASARTSLPRALDIIEEQQQRIAELERGKSEAPKEWRVAWSDDGEPITGIYDQRPEVEGDLYILESRTRAGEWKKEEKSGE